MQSTLSTINQSSALTHAQMPFDKATTQQLQNQSDQHCTHILQHHGRLVCSQEKSIPFLVVSGASHEVSTSQISRQDSRANTSVTADSTVAQAAGSAQGTAEFQRRSSVATKHTSQLSDEALQAAIRCSAATCTLLKRIPRFMATVPPILPCNS